MKKILVASGSFKDVFSSIESCNMIANTIREAYPSGMYEVEVLPFCDGGEYSFDILKDVLKGTEVRVNDISNPYCIKKSVSYIRKDIQAHIVSSEIVRLMPDEDDYKNPLTLTDYGVGQVIAHAINVGCKELFLYIGGTSTVSFGLGIAKSLGVNFYDVNENEISGPVTLGDIKNISRIDASACVDVRDVKLTIVADGEARTSDIPEISKLKIGDKFKLEESDIIKEIVEASAKIPALTGVDCNKEFTGAAGGMLFGLELLFEPEYFLGGTYFNNLLGLETKIEQSDIVITGEGRFDNTACGKTPGLVARIANSYNKPVVFVCGQSKSLETGKIIDGVVDGHTSKELMDMGIYKMITCQSYYDENPIMDSYENRIKLYREMTPIIIKSIFERITL